MDRIKIMAKKALDSPDPPDPRSKIVSTKGSPFSNDLDSAIILDI
jgi:hypothetical protein